MEDQAIEINVLASEFKTDSRQELALSVLEGLSKRPKGLPSHLFYDGRGSELFQKIMSLEEYYPTRCEAEILSQHSDRITAFMGSEAFNMVELGCGDGAKTLLILKSLLKKSAAFKFIPLDISKTAVETLIDNLKNEYAEIPFTVQGLVAEYFQGLRWLTENASEKNLVLFLGSNIGNFNKSMAMRFLRHLWHSLNDGDMALIGFDLKKDLDVLYDAYNDSEGVTKEFNLNVLDRINTVLGGHFERSAFQHQGLYNVQSGAMESYLISQKDQTIRIEELGCDFHFDPWEAIHMEYSYKYLESDIVALSSNTGFEVVENFTDSKGYFVDSLWRVRK